jgi:signal transduction histidine kinase
VASRYVFNDFELQINSSGYLEDRVFDFSYSPIHLENGEVGGILATVVDTTQNVGISKAQNANLRQLKYAVEAAGLGTWEFNSTTRKMSGNSIFSEWLGIEPETEIDLHQYLNMVSPDDQARLSDSITFALDISSDGNYDTTYAINHPLTQQEKIVRAKGQVIFNSENTAYRFNGILQDVTLEFNARQKLLESEKRFRTLTESLPQLIGVGDPLGDGFATVSPNITEREKTEEILKYKNALLEAQNDAIPDAILVVGAKGNMLSYNKHFTTLWKIPQDIVDKKDDTAALQFAMTQLVDPQSFIDRVNYCYAHHDEPAHEEVLFKDGRIIERYGNAVTGDNGVSYGWAWYFRDITAHKALEKQKDDFISMASHELKTPVTSLKGYTQILHKKSLEQGNVAQGNLLAKMDNQIGKLTYLIRDLLDATQVSGGQLSYVDSPFDFSALVIESVDEIQQTAPRHKIKMSTVVNGIVIFGDRNRIGQAMINLLSNAIKYSPNADEVLVNAEITSGYISFYVKDFGIGISADKQQSVFDRFFRVTDAKQNAFSGLGLGLYISSEIINRHKGEISVQSIEGEGSTFCFTLPINKEGQR